MRLFFNQNLYHEKIITKSEYIESMYNIHCQLFEYSRFIENTDIDKIEIQDSRVVFTCRSTGIRFTCPFPDKRVAPIEVLNFGFYERKDSDMIFKLVKPGFNIFDVGANVGWYSLNIAKRFPSSHVFAFEPIPSTFSLLKNNCKLNSLDNLSVYEFGFSNQKSQIQFYLDTSHSVSASSKNLYDKKGLNIKYCQVQKLDDFVDQNNVSKLHFLKVDVEGAELFVFHGGIGTIEKDRPIIFAEMLRKWSAKFGYHPNDIIQLLSDIGYHCFYVNEDSKLLMRLISMNEQTIETNYFFLHSQDHVSEIELLSDRTHTI